MELGIGFQIIRSDNDALNLRVAAWNGLFGGVAEIYVAIGDLQVAARQLRGFPNNPADKRVIDLGCFDRKYAGGSVSMNFHCVDGADYVYVETTIDSNCIKAGTIQTVILTVPIEASGVEHFVKELARLEFKSTGTARLRGVHEGSKDSSPSKVGACLGGQAVVVAVETATYKAQGGKEKGRPLGLPLLGAPPRFATRVDEKRCARGLRLDPSTKGLRVNRYDLTESVQISELNRSFVK